MNTDKVYNSDTEKQGNPYKKKLHDYDTVELFKATHVKRYMSRQDVMTWEFTNGTSFDLKVTEKFDKNVYMKLPDEIINVAPQTRVECAVDIFWTWKRPIGKQTQDQIKVTDLLMRTERPDTPIVARLKREQSINHPELFDSAGNPHSDEPFHAGPIVNPNPPSDEARAAIEAKGRAAFLELQRHNRAEYDYWPECDNNVYPWDLQVWEFEKPVSLDEVFGKREKRPIVNPGSWTHDAPKRNKFYADLNDKGWNKYGIPGPEKSKHIHTALGVTSLHETNLSPDVALVTVLVHLDKLFGKKDEAVTAPETTTEITKDQWREWLDAHTDWTSSTVIAALDYDSVERGEGPVTKFSAWDGTLESAETAVKSWIEKIAQKATPSNESEASQSTGHVEPAATAQAAVVTDEPAIEATVIKEPMQFTDDRIADIRSQPQKQSLAIVQAQNSLASMPIVAQWDIMRQQADILVKSGFLPQSVKTAEQAIAIMMMGQALNIEPIVALNTINVISGKPTVSPQLMLALVRRSGQLESFKVSDDGQCCTVEMKRRGEPLHVEKFSMEDAQRMKTTEYVNGNKTTISLSEKYNWKAQPAVMRKWRAIAAACRVVFPDVTWGIASYTTEEIDPDIVIEAEVA